MFVFRTIFFGTADLACASLEALAMDEIYKVVGVVTQPDRPRGRALRMQPSPVKETATRLGFNILQPERARDPGFISEIASLSPDLIVVAAYGQILPQTLLDLPRFGAINVHTSLLPKYRGAAPIQWAMLDGESETGVTIMKMDAGLDTGPMLSQVKTPINQDDTGQTLHDRLARLGAHLLIQTLPKYLNGTLTPTPQPGENSSYARKISKSDGLIDWTKPVGSILNQIRAFTPWPGTFTWLNHPKRLLKIVSATVGEPQMAAPGTVVRADNGSLWVACGEGTLQVQELQIEGGKRMDVTSFLLGHPLPASSTLGLTGG